MPRPTTYVRPFGPKAPWNIPVAGLPKHPQSSTYASALHAAGQNNYNFRLTDYTYPVFYASDANTTLTVSGGNATINGTKIPWNSSWSAASGSDAQIIVLDEATGKEWDLWQAVISGTTLKISNGSLIGINENLPGGGPASYKTKENGWAPSRGVGIQYFAMLVTPEEVAQGLIPHALSMPCSIPSKEEYWAPATKLEHSGTDSGTKIPEGARFSLNVTMAEIDAWVATKPAGLRKLAKTLAVALRDYGWFITDTSGSNGLQGEAVNSARSLWQTVLGTDPTSTAVRDILDGLINSASRIITYVPSDQYGDVIPPPVVNKAPIVSIVGPSRVNINTNFTLTGIATDDGLPNPPATMTYQWTKTAGPGTIVFSAPTSKVTNAVTSTPGGYTFSFRASDSALSSTASTTVTIEDVVVPPPPEDCEELQTAYDTLLEDFASAEAEIARLKLDIVRLQSDIDTLTIQLNTAKADYATLTVSFNKLKTDYDTLVAANKIITDKYNSLKTEVQRALDNN